MQPIGVYPPWLKAKQSFSVFSPKCLLPQTLPLKNLTVVEVEPYWSPQANLALLKQQLKNGELKLNKNVVGPEHFTYESQVTLKAQQIFKKLPELPIAGIQEIAELVKIFDGLCHQLLTNKVAVHPEEIISAFFQLPSVQQIRASEALNGLTPIDLLFKITQFKERQVAIVEACELAASQFTNKTSGETLLGETISQVLSSNTAETPKLILRLVLTHHPNIFLPADVAGGLIPGMAQAIEENNPKGLTNRLTQQAYTPFRNSVKPTPLEEAERLINYLRAPLYDLVPKIQTEWQRLSTENFPLEFGFWPGSDADGNPAVTAEIREQVAFKLKEEILSAYLKDLNQLKAKQYFTFGDTGTPLEKIISRLNATLLQHRNNSLKLTEERYASPVELLEDLEKFEQMLQDFNGLYREEILNLVAKVQAFGFHFATLDIRQHHKVHKAALDELLPKLQIEAIQQILLQNNYNSLNHFNKKLVLEHILKAEPSQFASLLTENFKKLPEFVQELLKAFRGIAEIQKSNGLRGLNRYIVSGAHADTDILEVMALAQLSGLNWRELPLHYVPLFEDETGLTNCLHTVDSLCQTEAYKEHLKNMNSQQDVMLGYSDGSKDVGFFEANRLIVEAKKLLSAYFNEQKIDFGFFDGRGGATARGGGHSGPQYTALGLMSSRRTHVTKQGEIVYNQLGNEAAAHLTVSELLVGILKAFSPKAFPLEHSPSEPEDEALITKLAELSRAAYIKNIRDNPVTLKFLQEYTGFNSFGDLKNTSRPVKRNSQSMSFADIRAIPWVGANAASGLAFIPGTFGLGSALNRLNQDGRLTDLKGLYQRSLLFRSWVENTVQSLSKSDLRTVEYLAHDTNPEIQSFFQAIKQEYKLSIEWLNRIADQESLMQDNPVLKRSIEFRQNLIVPISVIQQWSLYKLRELREQSNEEEQKEAKKLAKLRAVTLSPILTALRNCV